MSSFRVVLALSLAAGAVSPSTASSVRTRLLAKLAEQGLRPPATSRQGASAGGRVAHPAAPARIVAAPAALPETGAA
ncbi:MAG: hypothetical protein KF858_09485 [Candidatus Sumerlaeia bacterium]|nr:hypothetical protein [Candidatus Sumerlaeia bacterium]